MASSRAPRVGAAASAPSFHWCQYGRRDEALLQPRRPHAQGARDPLRLHVVLAVEDQRRRRHARLDAWRGLGACAGRADEQPSAWSRLCLPWVHAADCQIHDSGCVWPRLASSGPPTFPIFGGCVRNDAASTVASTAVTRKLSTELRRGGARGERDQEVAPHRKTPTVPTTSFFTKDFTQPTPVGFFLPARDAAAQKPPAIAPRRCSTSARTARGTCGVQGRSA